jgi:hypothetical protein
MFGQKITNTNEMLQYRIWNYADLGHPKSGQLNTAQRLKQPKACTWANGNGVLFF